jgi:hypothetical protein
MKNTPDQYLISENCLHGIYQIEQLDQVLEKFPIGSDVSLPIIDYQWPLWGSIEQKSDDYNFFVSIFQDELNSYTDLSNKFNINIILYKPLKPNEFESFQNTIVKFKSVKFVLVVNKSWFAEEVYRTLSQKIKNNTLISFDSPTNKFKLSKNEQQELLLRFLKYKNSKKLRITQDPLITCDKFSYEYQSKVITNKNIPLPSLKEFFIVLNSQLKAVTYFLTTHPLIFIISTFYSIYSIILGFFSPAIFFISKVIPIRVMGYIKYSYGKINKFWWDIIVQSWWDYGEPIRKLYFILLFHFENRNQLPKKILLILRGKKKPW